MNRLYLSSSVLLIFSCTLWEYEDPSNPIDPRAPDTYLSLIASDTVFAAIDSLTGEPIYAINETPTPNMVWDTLTQAFTTITTSKQQLHWWGEDADGDVVGYYYKWNVDSAWSFTTTEAGLFYVPIRSDLDVFWFEIKALDNDSLVDATPAKIVLPIRNSKPSINFRFRSNPFIADIGGDTSFTFPTRTFVWDVLDQDGVETITDVYYALDDTCTTCWTQLSAAAYSSITLTGLELGYHTLYFKARDIAGAESKIVQFPDIENQNEPDYWKVIPVQGDVLLIDDFVQDSQNNAQQWYRSVLDTALGPENYSVWEIGRELPYSSTDLSATLNYFNHVIWYSAYTGIETYLDAGANISNFIDSGGDILLNVAELKDSTFVFFPLDSSFVLNPQGRIFAGRLLDSQIAADLDLIISNLIAVRLKGFEPDVDQFATLQTLYKLAEPGDGDEWTGTPTVCSIGQFQVSPTQLSGKVVLMSIPMHNGSQPLLDGDGSGGKFISYLLKVAFQ